MFAGPRALWIISCLILIAAGISIAWELRIIGDCFMVTEFYSVVLLVVSTHVEDMKRM